MAGIAKDRRRLATAERLAKCDKVPANCGLNRARRRFGSSFVGYLALSSTLVTNATALIA